MAKYLSNRQKNLKVGISSYTENRTVLEVTGDAYISGNTGIGTTNPQTKLEIGGVLGFTDDNVRIGDNTTGSNLVGIGPSPGTNNVLIGIGAGQGLSGIIDYYSIAGITSSTTIIGQANHSYNDLSGTGGSGTGALFTVFRDYTGAVNTVYASPGGSNYQVGNVITIDGALVGGVSGTDDITFSLVSVTGSTGSDNNFLGYQAGYKNNAYGNNFFGNQAGYNNTSGGGNNFLGYLAGYNNISGGGNNFFGSGAGHENTTGEYNNFFGSGAGYYSTGSRNNFLGQNAGYFNTSGGGNNFLGYQAGESNRTGNNNIFLGGNSGISTSASNKIIIGYGANIYGLKFDSPDTTKDTQFAVGVRTDANPSKYWLVGDENFNVGIGTTNPTSKLTVTGDVLVSGVVTATNFIGNLTGTATTATNLADAANITTGTISSSRLSGTYGIDVTGTATTATNLADAANITTGFINKDRLLNSNSFSVLGDLYVSNNISFGGTTTQLNLQQLQIVDADIVLGIGTSFSPTDNTANHGGIAIASTEGTPLVNLNIVPGETNPSTYKKIMWFKGDTIGAGLTDAWLFNYGVGIGSTQVPNGVRLAAGGMQVTDSTITTPNLNITDNLGVGTTNPTSKLHVVGDAYVSGVLTVTDINSTSDIRYKENIQPIPDAVEKVLQLNGVTFDWKNTKTSSAGVIAQEVEKILPSLISGDDPKTVNYNGIIGLLVEAVKELSYEIEMLKQKDLLSINNTK